MSYSPRFAEFIKKHNLQQIFGDDAAERWVYREDLSGVLFVKDKDGLVYVNLAYNAEKAKKRRCKTTRRVSEEE
ncbi:hypothetical protein U9118_23970 [Escherichia coli]|uniref:hypothetical protein n=1 Tax=Escherichia coli TaxID=562 RepID=UPI001C5FC8BB|nr:hypothetical protein [Escherichia coli]MCZ0328651.1 hypothetical protein [Escherichia coli]HCJ9454147.1 hypothetical protein [Escherichia coli]HDX1790746.1 hypothetical protein [Escherichia coli]